MRHTDTVSAPPGCDDATLLKHYAHTRSEKTFAEFVQRHMDLVYSTALRCVCGDAHLAKDVTQVVFVTIARRAGALAKHRAFEGWLYTATRYEANHAVRREQRRRLREQKATMMNDPDPAPEPEWHRLRPLLDDAMGELNEIEREAVVMRFFLQQSFRDISVKLGLHEDAARRRVERALSKLHRLLARRGLASTAAAIGAILSTQAVVAAPVGLAKTIALAAVGSSAAAGATGFGLFHIMSTSKITATVGVALFIAAIGAGIHELNVNKAINAALATSNSQIDVAQREVTDLEQRLQAADAERAQTKAAIETVQQATTARDEPASKPASTSFRAATGERTPAMMAGDKFLADHPEARKLWDDRERSIRLAQLGPMFRAFNLTPEQISEMLDLMLQQQTLETTFNGPDGAITLRAEATLSQEEFQRRTREIFGDKFDEVPQYVRSASAYNLVAQLAGTIYRVDPLSSGQIDEVARMLTEASPSFQSGGSFDRLSVDWRTVMSRAQAVLSPTQLAALGELQQQASYRQAVQNAASGTSTVAPKP